jgi:hypothetical protein
MLYTVLLLLASSESPRSSKAFLQSFVFAIILIGFSIEDLFYFFYRDTYLLHPCVDIILFILGLFLLWSTIVVLKEKNNERIYRSH